MDRSIRPSFGITCAVMYAFLWACTSVAQVATNANAEYRTVVRENPPGPDTVIFALRPQSHRRLWQFRRHLRWNRAGRARNEMLR
jgi:hypothetical protein